MLGRGELIAVLSGLVLGVSVFLHWYGTDLTNRHSVIDHHHGRFSAWQTEPVLRYVLLVAAAAPLILAYVVLRQHQLSWPRGELTAVVSLTAFVLVLVMGFVARPGNPPDTISLQVGWFVALAATIGMVAGATRRASESARVRKPPGVL